MSPSPTRPIVALRAAHLASARRYAEGPLASALRWDRSKFRVEPAEGGSNSLIYFAAGPDGTSAVLQAFLDAKSYERCSRALTLGAERDLPTPRILCQHGGILARWRYGARVLAMERAPGRTLAQFDPIPPMAAAALGRALARLHSAISPRWGAPGRQKSKPYLADLKQGLDERLRELAAPPSDFGAGRIETLRRWMRDRLDMFGEPDSFQLCHHHLETDDVLYDDTSKAITLIDCASLQYSRAARDVAAAFAMLTDPSLRSRFLESYLGASPPERDEEIRREAPFFEAFIAVSRARNLVARAKDPRPIFAIPGKGAALLRFLEDLCGFQAGKSTDVADGYR